MTTNINQMGGRPSGVDFGEPEIGAHYSRFVGFAYIGVHPRQPFQGEAEKPPCGKVILTFELLNSFITLEDGTQLPRWVSRFENALGGPRSNVTHIYNQLDPKNEFNGDFGELASRAVPCIVNIEQKKDHQTGQPVAGTKVGGIAAVPAGVELPAVKNSPVIFDFDEPTLESYGTLKKWMRKFVGEAQNFSGSPCEKIAQQYEAQQAASQEQEQAQAQQGPPQQPVQQEPGQPTAPALAPVSQPPVQPQSPAPAPGPQAPQGPPAAPPGFRYDTTTNSYVPEQAPTNGSAGPY